MLSPSKLYLILSVALVAISSASGNYGYEQQYSAQCNRAVYDRAQSSIRIEIQQPRGLQQPPYDSSYSGMSNGFQANTQLTSQQSENQCRLVRQYFKELVQQTPLCETLGSAFFQNTANLIEQGRRFLQQYCERSQGYQHATCFKTSEIAQCENNFAFARNRASQTSLNPAINPGYSNPQSSYGGISQPVSRDTCLAYDSFRNCTMSAIQRNCYHTDQEHVYAYLVDHGRNLAWSCAPNQNVILPPINTAGMNTAIVQVPPQVIGSDYGRRTDQYNPYQGQSYPSNSYPGSRFTGRELPTHQLGSNQIPSTSRLGFDGINPIGVDHCIAQVQPYETACTELLVQRQRDARHGRSSNDVQRRICCAIFYYRDCLSRIVLERCRESSRTVVDLMMGDRNRELSTNCRDYTREQCSGVPAAAQASLVLVLLSTLLATIFHH